MPEPEHHRLTALPGKPNRVLPIGTIANGKHAGEPIRVHVHTGSTRLVAAADVPALRAHLDAEGIAGDYTLAPLTRTHRSSGHQRGRFAPPDEAPARRRARSSSSARSAEIASAPEPSGG